MLIINQGGIHGFDLDARDATFSGFSVEEDVLEYLKKLFSKMVQINKRTLLFFNS